MIKRDMSEHSLVKRMRLGFLGNFFPEGEFPARELPPVILDMVRSYEDAYGFPPEATALTALAVLSAAVGKGACVEGATNYRPTSLNIWGIIVAPRGSGKSVLMDYVGEKLFAFEHELMARRREWEVKKAEKIGLLLSEMPAKRKGRCGEGIPSFDSQRAMGEDNQRRINNINDTPHLRAVLGTPTSEALEKAVSGTPDGFSAVLQAEGKEVVDIMRGKYSDGGLSNFGSWMRFKTGDFNNHERITRPSTTSFGNMISLLLMVQPDVGEELIRDLEAHGRGFFSRILWTQPKFSGIDVDAKLLRPEAQQPFNGLIEKLLRRRYELSEPDLTGELSPFDLRKRVADAVQRIPCTPEAKRVFSQFQREANELQKILTKHFPKMDGECSRWRQCAIEVAGLFYLAEDRESVDEGTAKRACSIVRWYKMSFLFGDLNFSKEQLVEKRQRIEDIIVDSGKKEITCRELRKRGIGDDVIEAVLLLHPNEFKTAIKMPGKMGGRPSKVLILTTEQEKMEI
jgi:hypothetical protein